MTQLSYWPRFVIDRILHSTFDIDTTYYLQTILNIQNKLPVSIRVLVYGRSVHFMRSKTIAITYIYIGRGREWWQYDFVHLLEESYECVMANRHETEKWRIIDSSLSSSNSAYWILPNKSYSFVWCIDPVGINRYYQLLDIEWQQNISFDGLISIDECSKLWRFNDWIRSNGLIRRNRLRYGQSWRCIIAKYNEFDESCPIEQWQSKLDVVESARSFVYMQLSLAILCFLVFFI
jgi:hypothetical protein